MLTLADNAPDASSDKWRVKRLIGIESGAHIRIDGKNLSSNLYLAITNFRRLGLYDGKVAFDDHSSRPANQMDLSSTYHLASYMSLPDEPNKSPHSSTNISPAAREKRAHNLVARLAE